MTGQQRFLMGLAAGAAAVFAGAQYARRRRAIDFAGRVVVITGGARGLGLVLARQLAAEGAKLCLIARDELELDRAREQLLATGAEIMTVRCDVRRRMDVRSAVDQILGRWQAVDVLINNAGIIQVGPLEHMTYDDFQNAMATHFWGPFHLIQEVLPSMRTQGFGRIVNISSIGGRIAVPHLAPYSASKFALVGLSDAVRSELSRYGIRVTTVTPGLMRTGSPRNAQVKGKHRAEYALFAIADSLPGLTISAERAAQQIIEACRTGEPELTTTVPAKLAAFMNIMAPDVVARILSLATRLLPSPNGPEGQRTQRGFESESRLAPSVVTRLTDRAAAVNNEL